jgi:hypothetical protein
MRITAALAASLALHLGVLMLNSKKHSEGNYGSVQHNRIAETERGMLAKLTTPQDENGQHLTNRPPHETSSNMLEPRYGSITTAPESPIPGQLTSTDLGTQAPSPAPARYFDRYEVDRPPRIIDNLDATDGPLDKALADFYVNGSIVIELLISKKGSVDRLNIVNTTLPDAVVQIVVAQATLATFIPAMLNHKAVPSRIVIELSIREKPKD